MAEPTPESELQQLLVWQVPRCKKISNSTTGTVSMNHAQTVATAPPPTVTTAGTSSFGPIPTANEQPVAPAGDVVELSELHLAEDLLLRYVVHLPGLAKYCGVMCDAALEDNPGLPELGRFHLCGSEGRNFLADPEQNSVGNTRDVQAACTAREMIAATAASAFLNSSPSAWDDPYLVWENNTGSDYRDESVQSYLSLDRKVVPAGLDLSQDLLAAEDFGLTPFAMYYFTEPDFLTGMAKSFEHIGSPHEEFQWTHCSPKDNTCKTSFCREYFQAHLQFPRSARTSGPDSTIVKDIVTQIMLAGVAKPDGRRPNGRKLSLGRQVLRKLWTKLVSINGTFAIIGDGQYEMICMRHRHLQTLFTSPCYDVSRDPYDRKMPSQMRVRIGLNIIATLDLVWRANLWRNATRIGIQLPINALSKHITTFVTAGHLAEQLVQVARIQVLCVKAPALLRCVTRREQPPQPDIDRVLDLNNHSHALALDVGHRLPALLDSGYCPGVYLSGNLQQTEMDHAIEVEAHVLAHGDGAIEWDFAPLVAQIALGVSAGKQLEIEYQHRLRISATSSAANLPQLYGIFGDLTGDAHFLLLEDIGFPLGRYLDYLSTTYPKSRLLGRVKRLDEELRDTLNRLHATSHTHGALLSISAVSVALDQLGSIRLIFKNLREMQFWPSQGEEETKRKRLDIVHMNEIVQSMYTTYGLAP